ncbi:MAG TPA: deoxyribodipyrimidine photo-lyase [Fimbriimonadaceae bacterium]|jgi:deoxyribodipyrimidine photo-lyase
MRSSPTILWFRQDLRLDDNAALEAALERGEPIIPVYIWSEKDEGDWPLGAASRWWLHQSLTSLQSELEKRGPSLTIRIGGVAEKLAALAKEVNAGAIYFNSRYEPAAMQQEQELERASFVKDLELKSFNSSLLFDPSQIRNQSGGNFKVFTPYYKACLNHGFPESAFDAPKTLPRFKGSISSHKIEDLKLLPKINWAAGFVESWSPGEKGASKALKAFEKKLGGYLKGRERPDLDGVSRLSPHLHFGEIGPRQIVSQLNSGDIAAEGFLRQLVWREFSYYTLFHNPETPLTPLDKRFQNFPWEKDQALLTSWQKGQTGFPLVDAGMRQLWHTGYMHNRVRMVVASFLVKDLLLPWQEGARWFWDTLVDADLANNTMGWQWTSGCGVDAAPYFRIFNPVKQGEKFDPDGAYVKQWVPELKELDAKWIHHPWNAPSFDLEAAGIRIGETYPERIVDHDFARKRALSALASISK